MRTNLPGVATRSDGATLGIPLGILFGALILLYLVVPFGQVGALRDVLAIVVMLATLFVARFQWRALPLLLPMAMWIGWCALSAMWSIDPYATLKATGRDWVLGAGVFYGAWLLAQSPARYRRLVLAATVGLLLLAGLSVALFFMAPPGAEVTHELRQGLFRFYPGVGVASTYAAFLLPLGLVWLGRPSLARLAWVLVFVAAAVAVGIVAKNRMFWLVMMIAFCGAVVLAWRDYSSRQRVFSVVALMVFLAIAGALFLNTLEERSGTSVEADTVLVERSFVDDPRLTAWGYWLDKAAESPLRGNGYGKKQLKQVHTPEGRARIASVGEALLTHAHNLVIDIALQTGMVGLALFFWLIATLVRAYWQRRSDGDAEVRCVALAGLLLVLMLFGKNFTDDFFENPMTLVFWASAGLLLGRMHAPTASALDSAPASV